MRNYKFNTILLIVTFLFLSNFSFSSAQSSNGINVNLHVGSCNNNNICETGTEDFFSCPADCTPVVIPPTTSSGRKSSGSSLVMDNLFNNLKVEVSYNSATIKWQSAIPTMSNLKWGTNPDYKDGVIKNINYLLDHKVEIDNLKDGTLYYFSIQAENLLGKTSSLENQIFITLTLPDKTPPGNPTNVKAQSGIPGITISWDNPTEEDFDYIRVLRNEDRYYSDPSIGRLVYEGNGKYFTDGNVKEDVKYFYSLFSRDRAGNYSSGSLINIIFNPKGKDYWGSEFTDEEKPEPLSNIYTVTQGLSVYDFKIDSVIKLSGDELINVKTNYTPKTKNDDTWLIIRNHDGTIISQYFFSRIKDIDGFLNLNIPNFTEGGSYDIAIYRYHNGIATVVNHGTFNITKANTEERGSSYYWFIFWIIIIIILILLLLIWLFYKIVPKISNLARKI